MYNTSLIKIPCNYEINSIDFLCVLVKVRTSITALILNYIQVVHRNTWNWLLTSPYNIFWKNSSKIFLIQNFVNLAAIFLCNNLGTIFLEVLGHNWRPMTSSKPKIKKLHTYSSVFTRFNNLARLLTILQQSCWMQDCCKNFCGLVISYQYQNLLYEKSLKKPWL